MRGICGAVVTHWRGGAQVYGGLCRERRWWRTDVAGAQRRRRARRGGQETGDPQPGIGRVRPPLSASLCVHSCMALARRGCLRCPNHMAGVVGSL